MLPPRINPQPARKPDRKAGLGVWPRAQKHFSVLIFGYFLSRKSNSPAAIERPISKLNPEGYSGEELVRMLIATRMAGSRARKGPTEKRAWEYGLAGRSIFLS